MDVTGRLISQVRGFADQEQAAISAVSDAIDAVNRFEDMPDNEIIEQPDSFSAINESYRSLNDSVQHLDMVTENYPELRSNKGFLDTTGTLDSLDQRIGAQTTDYNQAAHEANDYLQAVPRRLSMRVSEDDLWPLIQTLQPVSTAR